MDNCSLWKLTCEAGEAIAIQYEPVFERFRNSSGLDRPILGLLLAALSFDPEVTSPGKLLVRIPYTAADTYMARLWVAAEKGYMIEVTPGEYRLTAFGRARVETVVDQARVVMDSYDPLPAVDSEKLAALLGSLVQISLNTPPPPSTWSIKHSYHLMPAPQPPLPYIDQAISCLMAYRDDAHLAAWQETGLSATAMETLTLLWNGEANSLETICLRLARRGHSPQVYSHALEDLRERGFTEGSDRNVLITTAGRDFRNGVEEVTDHFFFAPWGQLHDAQRGDLANLLQSLRDELRACQ
jgi:hypothetical protein